MHNITFMYIQPYRNRQIEIGRLYSGTIRTHALTHSENVSILFIHTHTHAHILTRTHNFPMRESFRIWAHLHRYKFGDKRWCVYSMKAFWISIWICSVAVIIIELKCVCRCRCAYICVFCVSEWLSVWIELPFFILSTFVCTPNLLLLCCCDYYWWCCCCYCC